jgi:hypothetical protein
VLGPRHAARCQVDDIDPFGQVASSAADNALDHVSQPLGLVEDSVQPASNIPALRPREQQDGRQRLA